MSEFQIGEIVTAIYKTGKYIGEITEVRPQHYLVRILAVLKHPMQGDLHNPKDTDVLIFHERKALSYREQANIPYKMVKIFENEVPDYMESLKEAVAIMKKELVETTSEWAEMSLKALESLEKDYKL
ncbi:MULTISPECIES: kinase-associated lipoprotein B [Bacillaceae]|uniref:kinase-associated lipoprotein B n=1 Tax=Bacillaceae TaxID=186817 RepID=UPI000B42ED67|nr:MULTISPECIES: kinase-associated lipoprotein B [unclassified Bacillus (in: firmicutes)]PGY15201.1 kinase [Bacillus sp. AFS031507]